MKIMLHDGYLDSPTLESLSRPAGDHWHRILLASDPHGCFKVNVLAIHAKAFSNRQRYPEITPDSVAGFLDEYQNAGLLGIWEDGGRLYGFWLKWFEYNNMNGHWRRTTPAPPEQFHFKALSKHSKAPSKQLLSISIPIFNSNSITTSEPSSDHATTLKAPDGFQEFWGAYPRKVGKGAARKAWKNAKPDLRAVLHALAWQTKTEQWTKEGGQFVPLPATYLNQARWEDEPPAIRASVSEHPSLRPPSPYCDCGHLIKDCEIHRET